MGCALLLAQLMPFAGIGVTSPIAYLSELARSGRLISWLAYTTTFFTVALVCARPRTHELVVVAAAAVGAWTLHAASVPLAGGILDNLLARMAVPIAGAGSASFALLVRRAFAGRGDGRGDASNLVGLCALFGCFILLRDSYLTLAALLTPRTFDAYALHFDAALGFQPSASAALLAVSTPGIVEVLEPVYNGLSYVGAAYYGLQTSRVRRPAVDFMHFWVASAALGYAAYLLTPITGPVYAFREFPSLPDANTVPMIAAIVEPAWRNGLPSLHFAWAFMMWANSGGFGSAWLRGAFALFAACTGFAALASGEHYFVDLAAAIPFTLMVQALCTFGLPWSHAARRHAFWAGLLGWLFWVAVFRVPLIDAMRGVPGLAWLSILATAAAAMRYYPPLLRAARGAAPAGDYAPVLAATRTEPDRTAIVVCMFVLSGFAALVYQVLFSKELALTFGSQASATYTVIATYMSGMALGAWLGGRVAQRRADSLRLYGWCELAIGLYCVATPTLFASIRDAYVFMAGDADPSAPWLLLLRVGLGGVCLLAPTILMGMTLPLLVRHVSDRLDSFGVSVSVLYCANTLGAAFGALLAGYLILPLLGVANTTFVTAVLNFLVALMAISLHQRWQRPAAAAQAETPPPRPSADFVTREARRLGLLAIAALTVGGFVTLALEVFYIHLLAVVAGNSTYAFSLMLFAFLLGLGLGAEAGRRLLRARLDLGGTLVALQASLAVVVLAGVFRWNDLPDYFASYAQYRVDATFGVRELVRGSACFVSMFPPAFFIGALYPVAMAAVGRAWPQRRLALLGVAAALNTVGNIAGVLTAGFWVLPRLGALAGIQFAGMIALGLSALILASTQMRTRRAAWLMPAAAAILLLVQPATLDYTKIANGANVYFAAQPAVNVIDRAESADGGLTTVSQTKLGDGTAVHTLFTNGKFQGTDSMAGEMKAQIGIALGSLLHTDRRDAALVIGFGTGVSARTLYDAGFKRLDIVELSADIVRLAERHFNKVNGLVNRQRGVVTHTTDGRNFLMLQDRKYDVISMEISSIWFAGAASLYSREFYKLAKRRMHEGGVLQQWMQLHHHTPIDILYIVGSLRSEFRHVWLYALGGQGVLVATNDAGHGPQAAYAAKLDAEPRLAPLLAIVGYSAAQLRDAILLKPEEIDALLSSFPGIPMNRWVSTDDNLVLEYSTPKGNALDTTRSMEINLGWLRRFVTPPS